MREMRRVLDAQIIVREFVSQTLEAFPSEKPPREGRRTLYPEMRLPPRTWLKGMEIRT